ncbi:hypothetical protein Thein_1839 [Thermodesulfatator indicus DSM 15286]|uniref:Uncharacterized protein n=1 Tax=Thermodesulfatator indicus (strain DSM 15286 / JCM 11887 / CIR29812) TaxID=667014 RepID=F8ABZ6_THEID|nr:hypothetical protein [Thermodesulfatator indicus]AEH45694.1 hypothetical protein Thein_1839 [Thermodesulfatator indicus DSM 15286]
MEEDVAKALAYQVKRDLAERYFSARRVIEEDTENYFRKVEEVKKKFIPKLEEAFGRLYLLLHQDKEFINRFLQITGLKEAYFQEKEPSLESLSGFHLRGFTSKGRYKNLFLDCYEKLCETLKEYHKTLEDLKVEAEVINHEIEIFKEKYNLSEIMHFLKSLDSSSEYADLGQTSLDESTAKLEKKMEFKKITPPEELLPDIPLLPPLKEVQKELTSLAKEAFGRYREKSQAILDYVKTHS